MVEIKVKKAGNVELAYAYIIYTFRIYIINQLIINVNQQGKSV